ncbi:MAG: SPFH domain-containing protein [Muribaculaceae bacterium]
MTDSKTCPYCGEEIELNATTCPICGEAQPDADTCVMVCEVCNEIIPANSQICPICGESPVVATVEHTATQKEKKFKHIFAPALDSIFWDQSDATELVYKYPNNGITLGCVLTVRESQEVYFFKNGVLCDKFTAGRHVLSTQNLPILNKIVNLPSGGQTTFLAEVWFVSKLEKRNILWGTGGMRIIDPYFQIPVKVASRGQYGVRINDGALFLKKLVGTMKLSDTRVIEQQFRSDVIEGVKVATARYLKEQGMNINDLGTEYRKLGRFIAHDIQESFDEYGIELLNFNIEDISIDENDPGYQKVMDGVAENARLKQLGVNYIQQKQIDIAQTAAGNEGAGNFMGIGMGMGVGQQMGQMISDAMQQSGIAGQSAPVPPPPSAASFYVAVNGQTTGPFALGHIREMIINGEIVASTYVYRLGGSAWTAAQTEPEIARIFNELLPPPPPPTM